MESTGPKISSRAIRWLWVTFGEERRGEIEAALWKPAGRLEQDGALPDAGGHQPPDRRELRLRVDRPEVGVLVERVAHPQHADPVLELRYHAVRDRLVDEQPRARAAHVALVEEDPVDDALDRLVDRRVVEHDVRRLAAKLHRHLPVRARRAGA
jgi:hypothetical protein